jgi:hypothetical protein
MWVIAVQAGLTGPTHEEGNEFQFSLFNFQSTQKLIENWGKYLEALEKYGIVSGGRLGYLAQLLYSTP